MRQAIIREQWRHQQLIQPPLFLWSLFQSETFSCQSVFHDFLLKIRLHFCPEVKTKTKERIFLYFHRICKKSYFVFRFFVFPFLVVKLLWECSQRWFWKARTSPPSSGPKSNATENQNLTLPHLSATLKSLIGSPQLYLDGFTSSPETTLFWNINNFVPECLKLVIVN